MKKILFVANDLKKFICVFYLPLLKKLKAEGYEIHVAAHDDLEFGAERPSCDVFYDIPFVHTPFSARNFANYHRLKKILNDTQFDLVHCHTPIASVLLRLACKEARCAGTQILYTAHGFHFYEGAPLIGKFLYYPVEKWCAKRTDVLITINAEDYAFAKKHLHAKDIRYLSGVGVDTARFTKKTVDRMIKRKSLAVPQNAFLLLSVGELSKNKNHRLIIRALPNLPSHVHYAIVGEGVLRYRLERYSKSIGVEERVHFLGYRYDVSELFSVSDLYVHPSFREGLPVAVMEAMASGLSVIASDVRGNRDLIDEMGGLLLSPRDVRGFTAAILLRAEDERLCYREGHYNSVKVKRYEKNETDATMLALYDSVGGMV